MAIWKIFGGYLESLEWTIAFVQAGAAAPGTADSFLKVSYKNIDCELFKKLLTAFLQCQLTSVMSRTIK